MKSYAQRAADSMSAAPSRIPCNISDVRPEAVAQLKLQELGEQSAQVKQLRYWQAKANAAVEGRRHPKTTPPTEGVAQLEGDDDSGVGIGIAGALLLLFVLTLLYAAFGGVPRRVRDELTEDPEVQNALENAQDDPTATTREKAETLMPTVTKRIARGKKGRKGMVRSSTMTSSSVDTAVPSRSILSVEPLARGTELSIDRSPSQSLLPTIGSSSAPTLRTTPVISDGSSMPTSRTALTNEEARGIAEATENRSKPSEERDVYKKRLTTKLGRGINAHTSEEIDRIVSFAVFRYFGQESKSGAATSTSSSSSSSSSSPVYDASSVKTYSNKLGGAIVLVEGNFVVVMEHYQLKHNPDIAILNAGGPYKGERGSTLEGGWDAHANFYAPAILDHVTPLTSGMNVDKSLILKKVRLDGIDAYISVVFEDGFYFITYHGNPPS